MSEEDDLFLPPDDVCAYRYCGLGRAKHVDWQKGGPLHAFESPNPRPRPDRIASSSITTQWDCTHCGAYCEVSGFADSEWMECFECGKYSYLMCMP